ncbi:hypothetical protein GOV10_00650, partial [Candidatus Woesearchaeota archaeon]|nr:hypothetical protein [Candidatus Woesearchaeota archaeon]
MVSFNADGSLKAPPKKHRDHLPLLQAIDELPFGVGKKLLIDHLRGKRNARTAKLRFDRYLTNGDLSGYDEEELGRLISHLHKQELIDYQKDGRYTTLALTMKGADELLNPQQE